MVTTTGFTLKDGVVVQSNTPSVPVGTRMSKGKKQRSLETGALARAVYAYLSDEIDGEHLKEAFEQFRTHAGGAPMTVQSPESPSPESLELVLQAAQDGVIQHPDASATELATRIDAFAAAQTLHYKNSFEFQIRRANKAEFALIEKDERIAELEAQRSYGPMSELKGTPTPPDWMTLGEDFDEDPAEDPAALEAELVALIIGDCQWFINDRLSDCDPEIAPGEAQRLVARAMLRAVGEWIMEDME
jgi:hypothetical protein